MNRLRRNRSDPSLDTTIYKFPPFLKRNKAHIEDEEYAANDESDESVDDYEYIYESKMNRKCCNSKFSKELYLLFGIILIGAGITTLLLSLSIRYQTENPLPLVMVSDYIITLYDLDRVVSEGNAASYRDNSNNNDGDTNNFFISVSGSGAIQRIFKGENNDANSVIDKTVSDNMLSLWSSKFSDNKNESLAAINIIRREYIGTSDFTYVHDKKNLIEASVGYGCVGAIAFLTFVTLPVYADGNGTRAIRKSVRELAMVMLFFCSLFLVAASITATINVTQHDLPYLYDLVAAQYIIIICVFYRMITKLNK